MGIWQGEMACLEGTHSQGSVQLGWVVGTLQRDGPQHITLG